MSEIETNIEEFWSEENKKIYNDVMTRVIDRLYEINDDWYEKNGNHPIRFVESRLKSPESIKNKIIRKGRLSQQKSPDMIINDLAGVRAICYDVKQVYMIAGKIKQTPEFDVIKEKDYISKPKSNGYQSYHIILKIKEVKVELQIRTIIMDAWSSLETILIYKKTNPIQKDLENNVKKISKWSMKIDSMVDEILEKNGV